MTDFERRHRLTALWILAPLTVGALSVTTDWALHHDPTDQSSQTSANASAKAGAPDPRLAALQAQVAYAAQRINSTQQTLRQVEHTIRMGAARVAALKHANATAGGGPGGGALPPLPPVSSAPLPAAPPVVNTTTGAS